MTDVLVHHAEMQVVGERTFWVMEIEVHRDGADTSERLTYVLPGDTHEWRAAEYGLDPVADRDEIHEIVLLEPFIGEDEATAAADPSSLHNAPTVADARRRLRQKIRAVKGPRGTVRGVVGPPPQAGRVPNAVTVLAATATEDPLAVVKARSPMDAALIAVKQEKVALDRTRNRARRVTPSTMPARPTVEALRERLLPTRTEPSTEDTT